MEREVWQRVSPGLNPWPGADAVGKALRDGAKAEGAVLASDAGARRTVAAPDAHAQRTIAAPDAHAQSMTAAPDAHAQSMLAVPDTHAQRTVAVPDAESMVTLSDAQAGSMAVGAQANPCCMGTEAETDTAVVAGFVEDEQAEKRQLQALARQSPLWARQTLWGLASQAAARVRRLLATYYLITGEAYSPAVCAEKIYVGKWLPALRERYHGAACTAMNYARAADGTPDPCLGDLFRDLSADAFEDAEAVARILERSLAG